MKQPNTEFRYIYRCAGNYKSSGVAVFAGSITEDERNKMVRALDGENYFIARQIGVPSAFPWELGEGDYDDEVDHCWHEFCEIGPTDAPPTDRRTSSEFIAEVVAIGRAGWKCYSADPAEAGGLEVLPQHRVCALVLDLISGASKARSEPATSSIAV